MLISNYDIRLFYKCQMHFYLDKYGPEQERDVHPILGKHKHRSINLPNTEEINANSLKTFQRMKEGKNAINQAWLYSDPYFTKIDRILKVDKPSVFGSYSYVPVFLRNVKHVRKPLIMEGVLNSLIISRIQETKVNQFLIQRKEDTLNIDIEEYEDELSVDIEKIEQILKGKIKISPNYTRNCRVCEWRKYCKKLAEEKLDLTLISGIGKRIKKQLEEQNITDVPSLAQTSRDSLILENVNPEQKEYFLLQAQSLIEEKERIRGKHAFPKKKHELFVDLEGSSHHDFVWIIGCLVREGGKHYYKHFLAETPKKEKEILSSFLNYIESLGNDYVLYHWSLAEPQYFTNLAKKYNVKLTRINRLLENSVDLFPIFKDKIILPIYTYTLKEVAKWLGFEWFEPMVDGATSIVLFDNWYLHHDRKSLDRAITYNDDDCKALMVVKDYVAKVLS